MITVNNISKSYNGKEVLNIDHLEIPEGQSIGLVGNNGAGKTTLFSLLLDLIQPSTGNILSKGVNVSDSETWKSYTSAFLDESFLIGYLTAEEYFSFVGELKGLTKEQIIDQVGQYAYFFNEEVDTDYK